MLPATVEAKDLISQSNVDGISQIFTGDIPENHTQVDETIVLIRNVNTVLDSLGNDDFYNVNRKVEIQIFFGTEINDSPDDIEIKLIKLFKHEGWKIDGLVTQAIDPDTKQLFATFYVIQRKEV